MKFSIKVFGVNLVSRAFLKWIGCYFKYRAQLRKTFQSREQLIHDHFRRWSAPNHPSLDGLSKAILQLNNKPNILETGTSAWGCDSSRLFDSLVREFGGQFISVDLRKEASQWLKFQHCDRTKFFTKNSIDFIKQDLKSLGFSHIDLCYLDSLDVDYSKPLESAEHHLNELSAIRPFLRSGSIVIIDDQPSDLNEIPKEFQEISTEVFSKTGFLPGKATLILREIEKMEDFSIILWKRSVVIQLK